MPNTGQKQTQKLKLRFWRTAALPTRCRHEPDPAQLGAPQGHTLHVREVRLSAGAGFVVMICGDIMTMPGLPVHPGAEGMDIDEAGQITGLY